MSQLRSPGLRQKFVLPADQRLNVRASGELWLKHSVEACAYPIIIILSTNGSPDPVTGTSFSPVRPFTLISSAFLFSRGVVTLPQACAARTRRQRATSYSTIPPLFNPPKQLTPCWQLLDVERLSRSWSKHLCCQTEARV